MNSRRCHVHVVSSKIYFYPSPESALPFLWVEVLRSCVNYPLNVFLCSVLSPFMSLSSKKKSTKAFPTFSTSLIGVLMYLPNSWGHADICDCLKPILNIVLHSQASMAVSVFQLCRPATGKLHTTLCIKYNYNAGMARTSLHSLGSLWPVQVVSFSVTSPNTCIFHSFCSLVCLLGAAFPGILQPCSRQRRTSSYCVVFYPG